MSVISLRSQFFAVILAVVFMLSLFALPAVADGDDSEHPDPRGIGLWSTADPLARGDCVAVVIWLNLNGTLFLAF